MFLCIVFVFYGFIVKHFGYLWAIVKGYKNKFDTVFTYLFTAAEIVTLQTYTYQCILLRILIIFSVFFPAIAYTHLIQLRVAGGLEPIPAVIELEAGYTLDRSPVHLTDLLLSNASSKCLFHSCLSTAC